MKYLLILLFAAVCIEAAVSQQIDEHENFLQNVSSQYPDTPLTLVNGKFYYTPASWTKRIDWKAADEFCRSFNLHLASFEDMAEQTAVGNWLIALTKEVGEIQFWTSGKRVSRDTFIWSATNEAVDMNKEKWLPTQPDNFENRENCLVVIVRDGKFTLNDVDCDSHYNILCERNVQ